MIRQGKDMLAVAFHMNFMQRSLLIANWKTSAKKTSAIRYPFQALTPLGRLGVMGRQRRPQYELDLDDETTGPIQPAHAVVGMLRGRLWPPGRQRRPRYELDFDDVFAGSIASGHAVTVPEQIKTIAQESDLKPYKDDSDSSSPASASPLLPTVSIPMRDALPTLQVTYATDELSVFRTVPAVLGDSSPATTISEAEQTCVFPEESKPSTHQHTMAELPLPLKQLLIPVIASHLKMHVALQPCAAASTPSITNTNSKLQTLAENSLELYRTRISDSQAISSIVVDGQDSMTAGFEAIPAAGFSRVSVTKSPENTLVDVSDTSPQEIPVMNQSPPVDTMITTNHASHVEDMKLLSSTLGETGSIALDALDLGLNNKTVEELFGMSDADTQVEQEIEGKTMLFKSHHSHESKLNHMTWQAELSPLYKDLTASNRRPVIKDIGLPASSTREASRLNSTIVPYLE